MKLDEAVYGLVMLRRYCIKRREKDGDCGICAFNGLNGCRLNCSPWQWEDVQPIIDLVKGGLLH